MNKTLTTIFALAVASVTGWASAQEVKGDAKAAENKVAMCIGCHGIVGYKASFPEIYQVPKISGQNAKYIEAALHAYKKGDRRHPTMRAIADSTPEGSTLTRCPTFTEPEAIVPEKPRKSRFGRLTYCTGKRIGWVSTTR